MLSLACFTISLLLLTKVLFKMSASFDKLSGLVKAAVSKITTLEAQVVSLRDQVTDLTAKAGTPDADVDALSAQLETVLSPDASPAESPVA